MEQAGLMSLTELKQPLSVKVEINAAIRAVCVCRSLLCTLPPLWLFPLRPSVLSHSSQLVPKCKVIVHLKGCHKSGTLPSQTKDTSRAARTISPPDSTLTKACWFHWFASSSQQSVLVRVCSLSFCVFPLQRSSHYVFRQVCMYRCVYPHL